MRSVPVMGMFMLGHILFGQNCIGHDIAVYEVLPVSLEKGVEPGRQKGGKIEYFSAKVHVCEWTPCIKSGRGQNEEYGQSYFQKHIFNRKVILELTPLV